MPAQCAISGSDSQGLVCGCASSIYLFNDFINPSYKDFFFLPAQKISLFYFQKYMQINNLLCLLLALVCRHQINCLSHTHQWWTISEMICTFETESNILISSPEWKTMSLHIYLHKLLSNCILLLNSRLFRHLTSSSHVNLSTCLSKLAVNALARLLHQRACMYTF